jgi:hypothetical protein
VKVCAATDVLGDGCVCCFLFEVQVLPDCTSTVARNVSFGGIFYQEGVELTHLLIRRVPLLELNNTDPAACGSAKVVDSV